MQMNVRQTSQWQRVLLLIMLLSRPSCSATPVVTLPSSLQPRVAPSYVGVVMPNLPPHDVGRQPFHDVHRCPRIVHRTHPRQGVLKADAVSLSFVSPWELHGQACCASDYVMEGWSTGSHDACGGTHVVFVIVMGEIPVRGSMWNHTLFADWAEFWIRL